MTYLAGGEYLCLVLCQTLQELGYRVNLATQKVDSSEAERIYGLGSVLEKCKWIRIPTFQPVFPRATILQKLALSRRVWPMLQDYSADIVFSTQSSSLLTRERIFHFVYNANDLYGYPQYAAPFSNPYDQADLSKLYFNSVGFMKRILWKKRRTSTDWFFAVGTEVLKDLRFKGYLNASLAFPPCRVNFKPRIPKKKRVVQVARVIPDKNLEAYFQVALRLPEYEFILVGRHDKSSEALYPGYFIKVMSKVPKNVTYINALIREKPELIEESQICMYTGTERGVVLGMVEAIAAGCTVLAPERTGAADVVRASGAGIIYDGIDDAIAKLQTLLKIDLGDDEANRIHEASTRLGPGAFSNWVKTVTTLEVSSPVADFWPA